MWTFCSDLCLDARLLIRIASYLDRVHLTLLQSGEGLSSTQRSLLINAGLRPNPGSMRHST